MEKWFIYAKKADFQAWARELGVDPFIARLIRNRDVCELEEAKRFLYGTLKDCHAPELLLDMERAASETLKAIAEGKRIRVIGDYDVDGICSSYILSKGLSVLGGNVDVAIPHRIHDGYGLNDHLIEEAAKDGVKLIVTCDNGISAAEQIKLAKDLGMDVIVTDHHEVPFVMEGEERREILPQALAIVDPKRAEDSYPFAGICGGVVAFKLLQATLHLLERGEDSETKSEGAETEDGSRAMLNVSDKADKAADLREALEELLELAAFATVCDIMELRDENRMIVREGLHRMQNTRNLGLRALMEVHGIEQKSLSAYHLGFILGPCLNATGRLDTATRALELLNAKDSVTATTIARDLKELNDSRKNLTVQGVEQAIRSIQEQHLEHDKVLVVYLTDVHESLAGIIAGRLKELYGHPTFLLTKCEDGVKGSGRSVEGYDMYEALHQVGSLLSKYGGHKMAAGLSLREENMEALRRSLNENCQLCEEDFIPSLHIDMELPMEYVNMDLVRQMDALEPFGVGNPKPLFAQRGVTFLSGSRMGKEGKYGRFQVETSGGKRFRLTFFGSMDAFLRFLDEKYGEGSGDALLSSRRSFEVTIAYQLGIHSYQGKEELQFLLKSYQ